MNPERTAVLLFYYFVDLKVNLDLGKKKTNKQTNKLGKSSPNFIFAVVNLDPIVIENSDLMVNRDQNHFVENVNRGEDLRWVGSKCPLMSALMTPF